MGLAILIIVFVVFTFFVYPYLYRKNKKRQIQILHQECRRKLRLPDAAADEAIARFIEKLQKKHPGRSEQWYLEKILHDLDRDHR